MECDGESQGGKQEAMPGTKGDGARGPSFLEEINKGISKAWSANALRHAVPGPDFVGIKGMDGAFEEKGLISRAEERGDLVIFEDGYTYYCPTGGGGLTAHNLRTIADELDRRNAPVDEWYKRSIQNDTAGNPG